MLITILYSFFRSHVANGLPPDDEEAQEGTVANDNNNDRNAPHDQLAGHRDFQSHVQQCITALQQASGIDGLDDNIESSIPAAEENKVPKAR